jgi:hypothetical protein
MNRRNEDLAAGGAAITAAGRARASAKGSKRAPRVASLIPGFVGAVAERSCVVVSRERVDIIIGCEGRLTRQIYGRGGRPTTQK